MLDLPSGVVIRGPTVSGLEDILTPAALQLLRSLHREFEPGRKALLEQRKLRQAALDAGELPDFLDASAGVRQDPQWRVAPTPADLLKRQVEITGPTERKMLINALNSGADVFMADFEDANSPTWTNMIEGQANLIQAVNRSLAFTSAEGKAYRLGEQVAVLMVRPRGWHLQEKHLLVDGEAISASLFDFALYLLHNAHALLARGSGPYFYLPKLESHLEARLWNQVFVYTQEALGLPRGTIRATVLIETILAAYEMEEILFELREHAAGLNAGRWDYIFSIIKKFRSQRSAVMPDRGQISMTTSFMRAYTNLLVKTCHKRGAHAIGGMAAYIPSRHNAEVNAIALQKVQADKLRESQDGFDGTWVAHPDLVPVARQVFEQKLGARKHQKEVLRAEVEVSAQDLRSFEIPGSAITESGLRLNISVGLQYIENWLRGTGAAAIHSLMEDAATAEISRAQLWQWLNHPGLRLADGRAIQLDLYSQLLHEEVAKIREAAGDEAFARSKYPLAIEIFDHLVRSADFIDFLTIEAYQHLE